MEAPEDWLDELFYYDEEEELEELRRMSGEPLSVCECCGGKSKVYAYRIGCYARVLCWMAVNSTQGEYLHVPSSGAINGGGDYAKLRYWNLIEKSPINPDPEKKSSGLWKLTPEGREFAQNKATTNKICYYRKPEGGVLGFEPEQISIVDCLGKKFNYEELMTGYFWDNYLR